MMEFVSWDGDIPNIWENKIKIHVPNHQPNIDDNEGLVGYQQLVLDSK